MTELEIKMILVKHIIEHYDDYIVGSEFTFQFGERRADIALFYNDELTAFEIKSARDNTSRLEYQIESYKKFFDYCFIVCEEENLDEVRKSIPKDVGIMIVKNDKIKKIRKSNHYKKYDKKVLSSVIPVNILRKLLSNPPLKSKNSLCDYAAKKTPLDTLKQLSRDQFIDRYAIASKLLKQESSSKITPDDIYTITKKSPTPLSLKNK